VPLTVPGPLEKLFEVPSGYLCIDGNLLRPISSAAVKKREVCVVVVVAGVSSDTTQVLLNSGMCLISLVLDQQRNLLAPPYVSILVCAPSSGVFSLVLVAHCGRG
jgi:hypothetical protein